MVKLIVTYSKPEDVAAFDRHYREVHAPLARQMPGIRKFVLNRIVSSPGGEPRLHLIAEIHFDDHAALKAALKSPEGAAAGKDVMGFAGKIMHMMVAEVEEG